jgi:hypothetical protein
MPTTRAASEDPKLTVNITEIHVNFGLPLFHWGAIVEGPRTAERRLRRLFGSGDGADADGNARPVKQVRAAS